MKATAEISYDADADALVWVGKHSLHQFWKRLAPYFADLLLPPNRRPDEGQVSWSWTEPEPSAPMSVAEIEMLRTRLVDRADAFIDGLRRDSGDDDTNQALAAALSAWVSRLIARSDADFSRYVCRTEAGLRMHSWGAFVAARPYNPDSADRQIEGKVRVEGRPAPDVTVVLSRASGEIVLRVETGNEGGFRFEDVAPGDYRIRARADEASFPEEGYSVVVRHEAVGGIELRGTRLGAEPGSEGRGKPPQGRKRAALWAGLGGAALVAGIAWALVRGGAPVPARLASAMGPTRSSVSAPTDESASAVQRGAAGPDVSPGSAGRGVEGGQSGSSAALRSSGGGWDDRRSPQAREGAVRAGTAPQESESAPGSPENRGQGPGFSSEAGESAPGCGEAASRENQPSGVAASTGGHPAQRRSGEYPAQPAEPAKRRTAGASKTDVPAAAADFGTKGDESPVETGVEAAAAAPAAGSTPGGASKGIGRGALPAEGTPTADRSRSDRSGAAVSGDGPASGESNSAASPSAASATDPREAGAGSRVPSPARGGGVRHAAAIRVAAAAAALGHGPLETQAGPSRPIVMARIHWKWELLRDDILPTEPEAAAGAAALGRLESQVRAGRRPPAVLLRPEIVEGCLIQPRPGLVEEGWNWSGPQGPVEEHADASKAELRWTGARPAADWRYELRRRDGSLAAVVSFGPGAAILELGEGLVARHLVAVRLPVESGPEGVSAWRTESGEPMAPALWQRVDGPWRRLAVPLDGTPGPPPPLALVDERTGWGLVATFQR